MLRRLALALLGGFAVLTLIVGVEILLALRREYLPTEPALEVSGSYGTGRSLRFVVLGDSTAAGVGAGSVEDAYPSQVSMDLADAGYEVTMTSLGVSGARVKDLIAEQLDTAVELRPDLAFVAIGANDVTHLTSLGDVRRGMTEIIETLQATGATVVVSGVPDMRAAAFYEPLRTLSGWRGRAVTSAIRDVAEEVGVPVVPLAELTGPFFERESERMHSADLFHPSADGYRKWADAISPVLLDALRDSP